METKDLAKMMFNGDIPMDALMAPSPRRAVAMTPQEQEKRRVAKVRQGAAAMARMSLEKEPK